MNHLQSIFQFCAYLLTYPDQEWIDFLEGMEEELDSLPRSGMETEIRLFLAAVKLLSSAELIANYVNTFDFGKKTNLYVTYMTNGEQRERGMDLLFLKNYYKMQGFEVTDKELPDYLPIMLEFASQVDTETLKPVFERYLSNIKEIENHLQRENSIYGHLLKAVLLALNEAEITKSVRRSDEICSNSFYG